jgi:7-carboxy-7-deazaguanine synthase
MPDKILISEIFGNTLQGEGFLAGQSSHFIRTAGCDYRCSWCDSMHAVDPLVIKQTASRLTPKEIVDKILALPKARWVTISGGDPVAWDLTQVILTLKMQHLFKLAVETQGSIWHDWLEYCDLVTVSPKPPSSGMQDRLDPAVLQKYWARLRARMVLKIVIFDEADLDWAERIRNFLPDVTLYLSSGTKQGYGDDVEMSVLLTYRWLAGEVIKRPKFVNATVLPQLHVLLWGHELGR